MVQMASHLDITLESYDTTKLVNKNERISKLSEKYVILAFRPLVLLTKCDGGVKLSQANILRINLQKKIKCLSVILKIVNSKGVKLIKHSKYRYI